jgi:hypothetical protein
MFIVLPMQKHVIVHPEVGLDKSQMRATHRPEAKGHDDNAYETEISLKICKQRYITGTSGMHQTSRVLVRLDCANVYKQTIIVNYRYCISRSKTIMINAQHHLYQTH